MRSRPAAADHGTAYEAIDTYVEGQMRRLRTPGAILAVVEGDGIVHTRGFGHARPGGEVPTPQTPFFLGSLTKSITALAVMQLVEAGKVELDAPVRRYLPWFRVADPKASAAMTVRHLLNQTSGLPESAGDRLLADFDDSPDAIERQARALSTLRLSRPVGARCGYSNLNYNLLGLIIEVASGQSYAGYVQEHIFGPLEMRHSYASKADAEKDGLAVGYRYWFGHPVAVRDLPAPRGSLPSGQLISSAEDMAHYLTAHLNGGRYGDARILSDGGISELHCGAEEYVKMGISSGKYGMGWFDTDMGRTKTYWHTGNTPDFSAYMVLLPEQKRGAVLLANAGHYGLPPILGEVGTGVTALLAGQQPAPNRLGFIPWMMRLLLLIPLLQIAEVALTLWMLSRWGSNPALTPGGWLAGLFVLLPLVLNLAFAATLSYLGSNGLLRFLRLFMPDLAWIAMICGGFAGLWAFLRTGLVLWVIS